MDDNYIIEKLAVIIDRIERLEKKIDELAKQDKVIYPIYPNDHNKDDNKGIPIPNIPYPLYPSVDPNVPLYPYQPIIYCTDKDVVHQTTTTMKLGEETT